MKTARSTALAVLAGALVGMIAVQAPAMLVLVVIASIGLLLGRHPALLFGLILMIDQTYVGTPYFDEIGKLVTTGHQLYEPVKNIPPSLLLLLLALAMQLYSGRGIAAIRLHAHGIDAVGIVLVTLVTWTALLSLTQEQVDFSAGTMLRITTNTLTAVLPWLLILVAYAVAVRMLREPGGRARCARVIAVALIAKGVLGLLVLVTTHGAVIDGQHNVVYYDAALPMVAGMAIIGFVLAGQRDVPWRKMILFLAGTIVVFSFRRTVWSAMVLALVLLPLVRAQMIIVRRVFTIAALSLVVLLMMPASIKHAAFGRVASAVSVAQGTGNESSAQNHQKDVEQGYRIAQDHVWLGIGVRSPQRREFAYQAINRLYVHNDPLQVWLRLGLPGVLLYLMLLAVLGWRGLTTIRRGGGLSVLDAGCAAFAMMCLVVVMPAPTISETIRWPVIIGLVAAVLRTNDTDARDAAAARMQEEALASAPARVTAPRSRATV